MFNTRLNEMDSSLIHSGLDAIDSILSDDYICHHGVKGQKKGRRQYQNEDGTWTELGKERRRKGNERKSKSEELVSGSQNKKSIFGRFKERRAEEKAAKEKDRLLKEEDVRNTERARKLNKITSEDDDMIDVMAAKTGDPIRGLYTTESFKKAYESYARESNHLSNLSPSYGDEWTKSLSAYTKADRELRTVMLKDLGIKPTESALDAIAEITYTDHDDMERPPAKKYNPDPRIKKLAKGEFV